MEVSKRVEKTVGKAHRGSYQYVLLVNSVLLEALFNEVFCDTVAAISSELMKCRLLNRPLYLPHADFVRRAGLEEQEKT